jgi:hypothetical protein
MIRPNRNTDEPSLPAANASSLKLRLQLFTPFSSQSGVPGAYLVYATHPVPCVPNAWKPTGIDHRYPRTM